MILLLHENSLKRVEVVILLGDLNLPHISWESYDGYISDSERILCDLLVRANMVQIIKSGSRENNENILDVVFINKPEWISTVSSNYSIISTDHFQVDITLEIPYMNIKTPVRETLNWKVANMENIREQLINLDKAAKVDYKVEASEDINNIWNLWKDNILSVVYQNVPKVKIKSYRNPPWFDAEVHHLLNKRKTAYNNMVANKIPTRIEKYKRISRKLRYTIRNKMNVYKRNIASDMNKNPKEVLENV
jgi:hypothetical protein